MGRPIKKRFFGSRSFSLNGTIGAVGGEEVSSIVVVSTGSSYASTSTVTFRAPDIAGGTTAQGNLTITNGGIYAINVTNPGSGYTSTSTLFSISGGAGSGAVFNASLTTTVPNDIALTAWVPGDSAARTGADIIKQEASHRYLVQSASGGVTYTGQCKLVATATVNLTAGTMNIVATDSAGGTYWVYKLTSRKAYMVPNTGAQFASTNYIASWSLTGSPQANVSVTIANN